MPLCHTCGQLDLSQMFIRTRPDSTVLGSWQVTFEPANTECDLCILAARSLPSSIGSCAQLTLEFRMISFGTVKLSGRDSFQWDVRRLQVEHQLQDGVNKKSERQRVAIQLLAVPGGIVPDGSPLKSLQGRLLREDGVTDVENLKAWISFCQHYHGNLCTTTTLVVSQGFRLRLIDTALECVVDAPPSPRYLALSYVWGRVPRVSLTDEALPRLTRPGGLTSDTEGLTTTVRDAMELCRLLEERYLWVDCLCIRQDDNDDKVQQIQNMNKVYEEAYLTIVCAAGEDANAGLPGIWPGSRFVQQNVTEIGDLRLMTCLPDYHTALTKCRWAERGWTFQEMKLSRRLLVFTEQQIYFQCQSDFQCEDVVFDGRSPDWSAQVDDVHLSFGPHGYEKAERYHSERVPDFNRYCNYVATYSIRQLSFSEDVLNAFAGMLKSFNNVMDTFQTEFLYGLPEAMLDSALCWQSLDRVVQRQTTFPSWSWAGWKCKKEYGQDRFHPHLHRGPTKDNVIPFQMSLHFYRADGSRVLIAGTAPKKVGFIKKVLDRARKIHGQRTVEAAKSHLRRSKPNPPTSLWHADSPCDPKPLPAVPEWQLPQLLRFWTSSSSLLVRSQGNGVIFDILDPGDQQIKLCDMLATNHSIFTQDVQPVHVEFIFVCYEYNEWVGRTGKLWVLAIEWIDGIAYRIQRAWQPLNEEAWRRTQPSWKYICLG